MVHCWNPDVLAIPNPLLSCDLKACMQLPLRPKEIRQDVVTDSRESLHSNCIEERIPGVVSVSPAICAAEGLTKAARVTCRNFRSRGVDNIGTRFT
jgi:hypothetical protein